MKTFDAKLQWLLDAAVKAPSRPLPPPPLGLETRVLAQWRAGTADDDYISLFAFFRRAMVGASLVLALSAAWSLTRPGAGLAADEVALLDYQIRMSLNP